MDKNKNILIVEDHALTSFALKTSLSSTNFYNEIPFMYHVGMDSHNCTPVLLEDIINEITEKIKECEEQL